MHQRLFALYGLGLYANQHHDAAIAVPVTGAIVGSIVHHQVVPVELDASGHITALAASNAIRTAIGSF
ncbi:MAG: hypothetical protein ACI85K_000172 [Hyphomicrobiaceae bacterium]|jgi:hypothetical protein